MDDRTERLGLLITLGRAVEGEKAARQAIAADPEWGNGYTFLALFLLKQNRFREARVPARDGVGKAPLDPWAHVCHALALAWVGRSDEAMAAVREALRLSPDYGYAHRARAQILNNDGRYREAARAAKEGLRHHPDDGWLLYWLGWAELQLGHWQLARELAERGLRLRPTSSVHLNLLGCAERACAKARSFVPRWWAHRRAEIALTAAVRAEPGEPLFQDHLQENGLAWRSDLITTAVGPIFVAALATYICAIHFVRSSPVPEVVAVSTGGAFVAVVIGLGSEFRPFALSAPLRWCGVPPFPLSPAERRVGRWLWRLVFAVLFGGQAVPWALIVAHRLGFG